MIALSASTVAAIDALVDEQRPVRNLPGVSLAVTDATGLLHRRASGVADVASGRPVTDDTLFEIGSISKSFTAVLVAQDALAGRVDLHAPVTELVPWFSVAAVHSEPITPHHLLGHTAGLVQGSEASTEARPEVWALRDTPAIATPGEWFHYSNVGYKTLGVLLEELHGERYPEMLRARILQPLGLESTEPLITSSLRPRLAVGHEPLIDDLTLVPGGALAPATWLEVDSADGSIAATATDLAAYLRAWLTPGPVLTEALIAMNTRVGAVSDFSPTIRSRYGYGWEVFRLDGQHCIGHGGGMVGYTCDVIVDLDAQLGVALLSNGPGDPGVIAREVLRIVRADSAGEPPPARSSELADPSWIPDAAALAGTYRSDRSELVLHAAQGRVVTAAGAALYRSRADDDSLLVDDEALGRHALGVQRDGHRVSALTHGPERLARSDAAGGGAHPEAAPGPDDPRAGHWRSHNPWYTNFRTFVRDGQLMLAAPSGVEAPGAEQPLVELPDGSYRVGEDPRLPERLTFEMVLDDRPQQVSLAGGVYHRTFTP